MKPVNSPSRALTPTVNPTSSIYYDDLHKAGFINDKQLAAAKSGNAKSISKADAEVFDKVVKQSLAEAKLPLAPTKDKSANTENANQALIDYSNALTSKQSEIVGTQFNSEQRVRDAALIKRYEGEGYKFIRSSNKDHNCLIVSILQHLTKDYEETSIDNHVKDAREYRARLNEQLTKDLSSDQKKNFYKNTMLRADALNLLLPKMMKEARFKDKDLGIEIWTAAQNGEKVTFEIRAGKEKCHIFQQVDHFVAIIPPGQNRTANSMAVETD